MVLLLFPPCVFKLLREEEEKQNRERKKRRKEREEKEKRKWENFHGEK
jgi:hypothetical protein